MMSKQFRLVLFHTRIGFCLFFFMLGSTFISAQVKNENVYYEKTENFTEIDIDDPSVSWGFLHVPESWNSEKSNQIKLAVTVLKSKNNTENEGLVFLQGGPGGGVVGGVQRWLNHPLRGTKDIILIDPRGTGFSEPKLCPQLGQSFMRILAEDYDIEKEITERVTIASECRDELLEQDIDISSYNSKSMAFDLHALKNELGYDKWTVYGVSYGTRVAYEYLHRFSEDFDKLILDSPIPLNGYYDKNTSNYIKALSILFKKCKQDEQCTKEYGDIEKMFYSTVSDLQENPIVVKVPKDIHPSGSFTMNSQDFLIAIQQGLYDKKFFEIMPLMIREFHNRNEDMISALVSALGGRLSLDYGTYYCVLCNETLPENNLKNFNADANQFNKLVSKGLPFYKGDYFICENWFKDSLSVKKDSLPTNLKLIKNVPTLILSGEFDPITPAENGVLLNKVIPNSKHIIIPNFGHGPSFSSAGKEIMGSFLDASDPDNFEYDLKNIKKQKFTSKIFINGGIYKFATSILSKNLYVLIPLIGVFFILIFSVFYFSISLRKNRKSLSAYEKTVFWSSFALSVLGILFILGLFFAILNTAQNNFYILAFGLPNNYSFYLLFPYIILLFGVLTIMYYLKYTVKVDRKKAVWLLFYSLTVLIIGVLYLGLYY